MDSKELIERSGSKEAAIENFIVRTKSSGKDIIPFPFQRLFLKSPQIMFGELRRSRPRVLRRSFKIRAYYPFRAPIDCYFQGKPLAVFSSQDCYERFDALSDHFNETARIKAKRCDSRSPYEFWNDETSLREILTIAFEQEKITPHLVRSLIYEQVQEAKQFRPSWVRGILKLLFSDTRDLEVLDMSAGWGDRLLACMSMDTKYHGFDPNTTLSSGHQKMIRIFGNNKRHTIEYKPFEDAELEKEKYDVCISSPPFFDLEHYCEEDTQSIKRYPKLRAWMEGFLFPSLRKIWDALKYGGYMALHLGDTYRFRICDAMNHYIDEKLVDSYYQGAIGIVGEKKRPTPVWVWQKRKTFKKNLYPYSFESMYEAYTSDNHATLALPKFRRNDGGDETNGETGEASKVASKAASETASEAASEADSTSIEGEANEETDETDEVNEEVVE